MHRIFILVIMIIIFSANVYAAEYEYNPYAKKNAFSVRVGQAFLEESDVREFWLTDDDAKDIAVSYERQLWQNVGAELSFGYEYFGESGSDIFTAPDTFSAKFKSYYVSLSGKYYFPKGKRLAVYVGGGPDYYHSDANFFYRNPSFSARAGDTLDTFGFHALAGTEFIIIKNPAKAGAYDLPVGLFIEYRYSFIRIDGADEEIISDINNSYGTSFNDHEFNLGGHNILFGVRWHF